MECSGDGDPAPEYTWFKDGKLLTEETRSELNIGIAGNSDHSELDFSHPEPEHEGYYHCEAVNDQGGIVNEALTTERKRAE